MFKWVFAAMQAIAGRRKEKEVKSASRQRCEACVPTLPILPRMPGIGFAAIIN